MSIKTAKCVRWLQTHTVCVRFVDLRAHPSVAHFPFSNVLEKTSFCFDCFKNVSELQSFRGLVYNAEAIISVLKDSKQFKLTFRHNSKTRTMDFEQYLYSNGRTIARLRNLSLFLRPFWTILYLCWSAFRIGSLVYQPCGYSVTNDWDFCTQ